MIRTSHHLDAKPSSFHHLRSIVLRGGRLVKFKGVAASLGPMLGSEASLLGSTASALAIGVVLGGGMLGAAPALAGTCSAPVGGVSVCTGGADSATDTTQTIRGDVGALVSVTTDSGFGIDTTQASGNALTIIGRGSLSFTDDNASGITGTVRGIYARNEGTGALSVTTTGAVTAIEKVGIFARQNGAGALIITATGAVTGGLLIDDAGVGVSAQNGIYANNRGSDLTISAVDVTSGQSGINGRNLGTGALTITSTGTATSLRSSGILATNDRASANTHLTVIAVDTNGGRYGIQALNQGTGVGALTAIIHEAPVLARGAMFEGPLLLDAHR